jgi:hypothetical protein
MRASRHRSVRFQYRYKRAKRRLTIGPLSAIDVVKARREARDAIHMAANGQDPAFAKKVATNAKTFADLATDYLEKHAKKRKRSWRENARILNGSPHKKRTGKRLRLGLVKRWGPRPLADIPRSEIRALLEATGRRRWRTACWRSCARASSCQRRRAVGMS